MDVCRFYFIITDLGYFISRRYVNFNPKSMNLVLQKQHMFVTLEQVLMQGFSVETENYILSSNLQV